jgi:RNA polymerase-binding transcription factor DksA
MDSALLARIQAILLEQRHNLTEWIHTTPAQKKRVRLGPAGEQAVHEHLRVLDTALEKAEDKTFGVCEICHGSIEVNRLEMDYTANVCVDDLSEEQKQAGTRPGCHSKYNRPCAAAGTDIPGMELAAFNTRTIVSGDYFDFFDFRIVLTDWRLQMS